MHPTSVDLVSLRLLTTAADLGSVAAAAAEVGLAQPTASERLSRLEHQLGMTLLDRGPSGSRPTERGSRVIVWARELLAAEERFEQSVADLRRGSGRPVRLAASYTIAEHLVPGWLASLGRSLGGGVELRVANSATVVEGVRADEVDLGFIESGNPPRDLRHASVGADELVLVAWPDHPWTRRREPVEARQLVGQPLVVRESGSGTREALRDALAAAGVDEPRIEMQIGSNTAVIGAVLGRVAPTVISLLAVRSHLEAGSLVRIPLVGIDLHRPLHAVWDGEPENSAAALLARVSRPD